MWTRSHLMEDMQGIIIKIDGLINHFVFCTHKSIIILTDKKKLMIKKMIKKKPMISTDEVARNWELYEKDQMDFIISIIGVIGGKTDCR